MLNSPEYSGSNKLVWIKGKQKDDDIAFDVVAGESVGDNYSRYVLFRSVRGGNGALAQGAEVVLGVRIHNRTIVLDRVLGRTGFIHCWRARDYSAHNLVQQKRDRSDNGGAAPAVL